MPDQAQPSSLKHPKGTEGQVCLLLSQSRARQPADWEAPASEHVKTTFPGILYNLP